MEKDKLKKLNSVLTAIIERLDTARMATEEIEKTEEEKRWELLDKFRGPAGSDGRHGRDGYTPIKGVDYFTPKEISDFISGIVPQKGIHYFDGRDGVNGKDADETAIHDKLYKKIKRELKRELDKQIEIKDIPGLIDELDKLRKKNVQVGGLRPADTGVETPVGTINGVTVAFTVLWKPQFVTVNGQTMYESNGYALTSSSGVLTITLDTAPPTGSILRSHY